MARVEFKNANDYRYRMKRERTPSLMALCGVFGMMTIQPNTSVQYIFDIMMGRMMAILMRAALEQKVRKEAERSLYEARSNIGDSEKPIAQV